MNTYEKRQIETLMVEIEEITSGTVSIVGTGRNMAAEVRKDGLIIQALYASGVSKLDAISNLREVVAETYVSPEELALRSRE